MTQSPPLQATNHDETNLPADRPLRVLIIGAGIAGLTCAIALRHNNPTAHVTLLEKSAFDRHRETGAALYVAPNVSDHLLRLGWTPESSGSNKCRGFTRIDGPTGQIVKQMDLGFADEKWRGSDGRDRPWLLSHRIDLHRELRRMAVDNTGEVPGRPAILRTAVIISHIDTESGIVEDKDGNVYEADAVIGADGNASVSRKWVAPHAKLKPWGKSCYRFLLDRQTLLQDPMTNMFASEDGYFTDVIATDRKMVLYPCRNNTQINFAIFAPDSIDGTGNDWDQAGCKAKAERAFESFWPPARKALTYAGDDLKVWQLVDLDPLDTLTKDRLALIGDAAHPFLPFLGQGAAQAQEDAVSLAVLLQSGTTPKEVPELLRLYNEIRRERAHEIQELTRRNGMDADKGRLTPEELFAALDKCYSHDEWAHTQKHLARWRAAQDSD